MPEYVLRHPDLPGQPVVVHQWPNDLARSGWELDEATSPDEARAELEAKVSPPVTDQTVPDDPPAEPVNTERAPDPLDLTKEK